MVVFGSGMVAINHSRVTGYGIDTGRKSVSAWGGKRRCENSQLPVGEGLVKLLIGVILHGLAGDETDIFAHHLY